MIALDTSAIVAIALAEEERDAFIRVIAVRRALVGAPTLLETRLVLSSRIAATDTFLEGLIGQSVIHTVDFSLDHYRLAATAFDRFGKGRGHKAGLNFGDCLSYAVAQARDVPLLFKGQDFIHTDIRPAL